MTIELVEVDTQGFKDVSKQEFYDYVNNYVGDIRREVLQIVDPPCSIFYDTAKGKFPDNVMAKCFYNYETKSFGRFKIRGE